MRNHEPRDIRSHSGVAWIGALVILTSIVALANCGGGEGPTGPGAPTVTPIVLRQAVSGAVASGQTVRYGVQQLAGVTLFVAFQARATSALDTLVATVSTADGTATLAAVRGGGSSDGPNDRIVAVPPGAAARALIINVSGASVSASGAFTLVARDLGTAPERSDAVIAPSATVTEWLDAPGDIDEFSLGGTEGRIAWLELAADTPFPDGLRVELMDGASRLTGISTTTAQSTLGELRTDPVALPRTGNYTVRVRAGDGAASSNTGSYRIRAAIVPPANRPAPVALLPRTRVVDTLSVSDSVHAWSLIWSRPEMTFALTIEALSSRAGDTVVAIFRDENTSAVLGTLLVRAGDGPSSFTIPLEPGNVLPRSVSVNIGGRRYGIDATYRVRLGSPLPDAPEAAPAAIVPGDTIGGETIGDPLDLDRFVLDAAPADSEWVVMVAPTSPSDNLGIRIEDRDAALVSTWNVSGQSTDLESTATYLKLVGDRGPYVVTVGGEFDNPRFEGGYRLWIARLVRGAESADSVLTPGDTVQGSIEQPGDVDEIRLDVIEGQEMYFRHITPPGGSVQHLVLVDGATALDRLPLPDAVVPLDQQVAHYRWRAPRTGSFRLRVWNDQLAGPAGGWPTPYEVAVLSVDRAPETAPATGWAYGDTIAGEVLEVRGDIDEFDVTFTTPLLAHLIFEAQRATTEDGAYLTVLDPAGQEYRHLAFAPQQLSDAPRAATDVPWSAGTYRLRVENTGLNPTPFRIRFAPAFVGPEVISDTLLVGTWVTGEAIDSIGDSDRYHWQADSGALYYAEIETLAGARGAFAVRTDLFTVTTSGMRGLGAAAASGWRSAVVNEWPSFEGPASGPYRLRIMEVDVLPESVPAAIAIGDTILGESLDRWSDVDDFTFAGAAGDRLRLSVVPAGAASGALLGAIVFDAQSSSIVASSDGAQSFDFTLPANGSYRIRVVPFGLSTDRDVGPYTLALARR